MTSTSKRALQTVHVVKPRGWALRHGPALLLAPGLGFLLVVFVGPIVLLLSRSLFDPELTLEHYQRMFAVPEYMQVLGISFKIALVSTVASLVCGYPLAYVLTVVGPTWRAVILVLVLLPFWTNILVRVYSWMLILQTTGVLNTALVKWLGVLHEPLPLMYNLTGVIIGMVHYLVPPMVLILYSVMRSIDLRLVDAAQGLGAEPWRAFWRVFVPLSMPGVRAATVLIFILGLGFFVTPALLGGRREITIAMLIETNFAELLNWGFGSALAVALLVVTLVGLLLYYWWLGRQTVGLPR